MYSVKKLSPFSDVDIKFLDDKLTADNEKPKKGYRGTSRTYISSPN